MPHAQFWPCKIAMPDDTRSTWFAAPSRPAWGKNLVRLLGRAQNNLQQQGWLSEGVCCRHPAKRQSTTLWVSSSPGSPCPRRCAATFDRKGTACDHDSLQMLTVFLARRTSDSVALFGSGCRLARSVQQRLCRKVSLAMLALWRYFDRHSFEMLLMMRQALSAASFCEVGPCRLHML